MAGSTFVHLLIASGVIAVATSVSQYQRFPTAGQSNYLGQGSNAKQVEGSCPEKNGRFAVANQCDAYTECIDGVPEQKLCPEGLVFNPDARFNYPCGYPIDVDCEGRPGRQPTQATAECPHQYGYFKVGDHQHCGQFMNCVDGRAYVFDCPEGLAFNEATYRCDWPDLVPDCDAEAYLGFRCPETPEPSALGNPIQLYRSNSDCQRYYICANGRPRLHNCGEGNAFNVQTNACEAAENVTGCDPATQPEVAIFDQRHQKPVKLF